METDDEQAVLSIRGKNIRYEYALLDIENVEFYRNNPRIASILSTYDGLIDDKVIDAILWDRNETKKLKRTIEKDGGLIHPVLVYNGQVLEGNTRLCCYKHLFSEKHDPKWKKIPCHVIQDKLDQNDIYRLLCTEHIEGKIDWNAYEKANLYAKMKNDEGMTLEEISELVGESTSTVAYRIDAYGLMISSKVADKSKYSHFEQLARNQDIKRIEREQRPGFSKEVVEMIVDGRVGTAQDIRNIGDIYKHQQARKRLIRSNEHVEQIYIDLKAKAPMTDSPLMKEVESLVQRLKDLKRKDREALKKSRRDCYKVEQLIRELLKLCQEIRMQIHIPPSLRKQ